MTFADSAGDSMTVTGPGSYTFNWGPITSFSITPHNILDSLDQRGYVNNIVVDSLADYSLTVNPATSLNPTAGAFPAGTVGVAYDQSLMAVGGTGLVSLEVSNVQNPIPGLSLPAWSAGSLDLSGTPIAAGTETFSVYRHRRPGCVYDDRLLDHGRRLRLRRRPVRRRPVRRHRAVGGSPVNPMSPSPSSKRPPST